ncbi:THAP domain-containing protein 6-like [Ixodes scapularis]|uniref:THAP domain-containing protein 6-like n=1 Tax=Ixodes scapularis TaxID=6945 RepID=UPI001A9F36D0|nr:THAP domain-containing protein 6-like [Ixodes scapularis]XP_042142734.1 THAP domain-containing protein 6-like [Ixodes scapularis]
MPRYCAARDCSNSVCCSSRPAHKFPSEPTLRKLWIRAARPSQPTWKPTKGDCLCMEHFEDEDYKTSPKLLQSLGLPVKQAYLKPGMVPSLFTRKCKRERHSGAVEKRRRKELVCSELEQDVQTPRHLEHVLFLIVANKEMLLNFGIGYPQYECHAI